jgi:hypothetical protein
MMNENIKERRVLITFSIDNEIIKNFKLKAKGENRKYSKVIEIFMMDYLKPNKEESIPVKIEEKKEYPNNELKDEEILKFFSNI